MGVVRRTAVWSVLALVVSGLGVFATPSSASAIDHYRPPNGVTINNPLGNTSDKWRIFNKIVRTINSIPAGGKIRLASWNIRSDAAYRALVNAHRRGVSVRVIMDWGNQDPDRLANPGFWWMTRQLHKYNNKARRTDMKSWSKLCRASCEGDTGMMHAKFFLFDKGRTARPSERYIVMHGSANLTKVAATNQWNNLYTIKRLQVYAFMLHRFYQMTADHYWANPLAKGVFPGLNLWAFPWRGRGAVGDPVMNQLNAVRCSGATGGTGYHGHTLIRIAQTVLGGDRGIRIANKLADLEQHGCRVRMVFTLLNNQAAHILRTAGIWRHVLAKDVDRDYVYETYLHLKAMTISGNWNGVSNTRVAFDGSHNWNAVSVRSDETFARISFPGAFDAYSAFVDHYLYHPVAVAPPGVVPEGRSGINPWSKVQVD